MTYFVRLAGRLLERLGVNAVPVVAVAKLDWPPMSAMMLYALENFVAMLLAMAVVRILAPVEGYSQGHIRQRSELLSTFRLIGGGFGGVPVIFILFFAFLSQSFPGSQFAVAAGMMLLFQLIGFVVTLNTAREASFEDLEFLLQRSLGRVFILFFATGGGMLAAFLGGPAAFVYPFVVLKTVADLWTVPSSIRGRVPAVAVSAPVA